MKILLVNDDGVEAPGFRLLAEKLAERHTVTAVAPDGNRSAVSHGLTLRDPLEVREVRVPGCEKAWAVNGTPADCTRLALDVLCPDAELVVSGPNVGSNVAFDILYSGTVGAALEAAMHGRKAIAVSAHHAGFREEEVVRIFLRLLEQLDVEKDVRHLLNINIPALPLEEIRGVRWVPMGLYHQWEDHYWAGAPESDRQSYRVRGTEMSPPTEVTDDSSALFHGYVALTPLSFRLTDDEGFREKEFKL